MVEGHVDGLRARGGPTAEADTEGDVLELLPPLEIAVNPDRAPRALTLELRTKAGTRIDRIGRRIALR